MLVAHPRAVEMFDKRYRYLDPDLPNTYTRPDLPELALFIAILVRALRDVTGDTAPFVYSSKSPEQAQGQAQAIARSARKWIFSNLPESDDSLSFTYICEALEIDAKRLRKTVRRWLEEGYQTQCPLVFLGPGLAEELLD